MNIETALNNFCNFLKKRGSSEKTQKKYYNQILKLFHFAKKSRKEIWNKDIEKYINTQKRTHNTKCTEIAQIKSFIKYCNAHNLINLDSRSIFCPKKEEKEARFFQKKEIEKIKKELKNSDIKIKNAILLLLSTGTRISEVCKITKKQLEKALLINWNYQINIIWKRKKKRSIFIPEKIWKICIKNAMKHEEKNIIGLDPQQLSRAIRKFRKKINIPKFTAHTFRHNFITECCKNWIELYKVQKLAGHSNINTTAHYLHCCDQELSEAVNRVWILEDF